MSDALHGAPGSGVLLREVDAGVVTLTLNRPDSYNALDTTLRDALLDAIRRAEADGDRCIVLRGAGRGFCAGTPRGRAGCCCSARTSGPRRRRPPRFGLREDR